MRHVKLARQFTGRFEDPGNSALDVTGTAGDDVLAGTPDSDLIDGLEGADVLRGKAGDDFIFGGDGDDYIVGGLGADYIDGGDGFDTALYLNAVNINLDQGVNTGEAEGDSFSGIERFLLSAFDDRITGSGENEWFEGAAGNDVLNGLGGIDQLYGGDGDDLLRGGDGDDFLNGDDGDDILEGRNGADSINGGNDADTITGGGGNDTMDGGTGADVFVYTAAAFGDDTINGWEDGVDLIQFTYAAVDDISDLTIADDGSGNTLITAPDGSTITLTGINFATVDNADFIFGP